MVPTQLALTHHTWLTRPILVSTLTAMVPQVTLQVLVATVLASTVQALTPELTVLLVD
jgi:hypothetical protein